MLALSPLVSYAGTGDQPGNAQPDSGLYLKVRLLDHRKPSALKPEDILEGELAHSVYTEDRELFPAGSRVRLTVQELEHRRRVPNDHWPWVIKFFTPRHENYPVFQSATVFLADGKEAPLHVSLLSLSNKIEIHAQTKSQGGAQTASGAEPAQAVTTGPAARNSQSGRKPAPVAVFEASLPGNALESVGKLPASSPASSSITLPTGTQVKIILLGGVSAAKSHPGDSFQARVIEPVRQDSRIVLPAGSILDGKVAKSTPPRSLSRAGSLYLRFTGLTLPGGRGGPIVASVSGAELDNRSHTRMDSEGGLRGGHPGKAWMLIHVGVAAGIAKVADDGTQLLIEAFVSTATDASTAGTARIAATCASGLFMITRHGRDVILPRFTEMDVLFDRPASVGAATSGTPSQ